MNQELYINGFKVDLSEDIPLPLTLTIADFKEPDKRKRSTSKTITIKGTTNNKNIFSGAYELSLSDNGNGLGFNIDPTRRVTAKYLKGGRTIFEGLCQLLQVNEMQGDYSFEVALFSDFVDIFQKWGDITIGELGWNEYDHSLNLTNLTNSWDTNVITNGLPVLNFAGGKPLGFGYLYPVIDFGYNSSLFTFNINDFVPYVYFKEIVRKAFAYGGYTVNSDFFNTDLFKALVFGFGGGDKQVLPPIDLANREVDYSFDDDVTLNTTSSVLIGNPNSGIARYSTVGSGAIKLTNFTENLVTDGYTQYDVSNGFIVVQRSGKYRLNLAFDILLNETYTGNITNDFGRYVQARVYKNGNLIYTSNNSALNASTTFSLDANQEFDLTTGDYISIEFYYYINLTIDHTTTPTYSFNLDLNNSYSFNLVSLNSLLQEGDIVNLSRFIPNMKVSEFFKGLITMFNLYIDDTLEDNTIKIEPLSTFYLESDDVDNWTSKLDHSKVKVTKPATTIGGKTFSFKFEEDKDFYNAKYLEGFGTGYGDYLYDVSNNYDKGVKEFKVPFAQTIPVEITSGYVIPRIVDIDLETNIVKPFKGKPRVFCYNGLKAGSFSINTLSGLNSYANYPQVHHSYGNIKSATFDLNFGAPNSVYYNFTSYQFANLFNNYNRQFIREISSIDSKVFEAYFKLEDLDIYKGMFRKLVNINGVLFRKNIVKDYDANGYETTLVELLKVLQTNDVVITQPVIASGMTNQAKTAITTISPTSAGLGVDIINGGLNSSLQYNGLIAG